MSFYAVTLPIQGVAAPLPVSGQEKPTKGLTAHSIPGGENLEELGMDNKTSLRADLYAKVYAQVIVPFEQTAPYSHCGPIQLFDTFKDITQFMGYSDIFCAAQVCKLWNTFSANPAIWQKFFIEEGIPFVESVNGQPRNYKQDFRILGPMTFGLKMSKKFFGNVPGEMPLISNECFKKCSQVDPFDPEKKIMMHTFKFIVLPNVFERIACDEFPFVLDKEGNLKEAPLESDEWRGKTLQIPHTIFNLKILCEHPLAGKENMPVFEYFDADVLEQCNTRQNKISVFFMRTCIADETRNMSYPKQKVFVKDRGFEVTSLGVRVFFDAVCILTSGTCPDAGEPRWSYARTPDTVRLGNDVYQVVIGGFAPDSGANVDSNDYGRDDDIGVAPGGPAEVPRTLALGSLALDKGH